MYHEKSVFIILSTQAPERILEKEVEHPNDRACLMGMGAPGFLGLDLSIPSGSKFHSLEVGVDCDIQLRLPTAENELRKEIFKSKQKV